MYPFLCSFLFVCLGHYFLYFCVVRVLSILYILDLCQIYDLQISSPILQNMFPLFLIVIVASEA